MCAMCVCMCVCMRVCMCNNPSDVIMNTTYGNITHAWFGYVYSTGG